MFPSLLEARTRLTVGSVTLDDRNATLASFCPPGTHPIRVILHVPEVAPPQACQLVHRFPPTAERFKPSRAFQTERRPQGAATSGPTPANERLVLPAPARGPRGGTRPRRSLCRRKRSPRSLPATAFTGPETLSVFA